MFGVRENVYQNRNINHKLSLVCFDGKLSDIFLLEIVCFSFFLKNDTDVAFSLKYHIHNCKQEI